MALVVTGKSGRSGYTNSLRDKDESRQVAGFQNTSYSSSHTIVAPRPQKPFPRDDRPSFLLTTSSNQYNSSIWNTKFSLPLLPEGVIVIVTLDSKCYHVVDLGGASDSSGIRKRISTKLNLFNEEDDFALYPTELGASVNDVEMTDDKLFAVCYEQGDSKGTLKFFVKPCEPSFKLPGSIVSDDEIDSPSFQENISQMLLSHIQPCPKIPNLPIPLQISALPSPPPSPIHLAVKSDEECYNSRTDKPQQDPEMPQNFPSIYLPPEKISLATLASELLSPPSSPIIRPAELEDESFDLDAAHSTHPHHRFPLLPTISRSSPVQYEPPSPPPSPPLKKCLIPQLKTSPSTPRQFIYQTLAELLEKRIHASHKFDQKLRNGFNAYLFRMTKMDRVLCLVHSEECRSQLLNMFSTLGLSGHPDIRKALEKDEKLLFEMLRKVLDSKVEKDKILFLEDEMARSMLNLLQLGIAKGLLDSEGGNRKGRRLFVKLSLKTNIILSSQLITGLEMTNKGRPVNGGGYADIFRAILRGNDVAIKHIRTHLGRNSQKIWHAFSKEALIWQHLKHPNVLPFLGIDSEMFPSSLCMISPWMKNGTIMEFREAIGLLNINVMERLLEIADGLSYLHSEGVIHGDLRGGNILVDDDWHALLADFGLTAFSDSTMSVATQESNSRGTTRWMAPELLIPEDDEPGGPKKTKASDMYAFGCVCLEIYTGHPPFAEITNEITVMCQLIQGKQPSEKALRRGADIEVPEYIVGFIERCWSREAKERPQSIDIVRLLKEGLGNWA